MDKVIWLLDNDRNALLACQRRINDEGSMRSVCMLSFDALSKNIREVEEAGGNSKWQPSLIIVDYKMAASDERIFELLNSSPVICMVPVLAMSSAISKADEENSIMLGAVLLIEKPFTDAEIMRIERFATQYDDTRNYEKSVQKKISDWEMAQEIKKLNEQLADRNELLYKVFGKYFSDEVVEYILKSPEGAAIGGRKANLTILMADLRDFTSKAQLLETEELTELLDFYFTRISDCILKYHGTIIEFMGDGVLAVFGAPIENEQHVECAVAAAMKMQEEMKAVEAFCIERGFPVIGMGIGVHCGETFIGNVGSERMMRYNVLGSSVNECARIEACSQAGQVLISRDVLDKIENAVVIDSRRMVSLKGIDAPVEICEVKEFTYNAF